MVGRKEWKAVVNGSPKLMFWVYPIQDKGFSPLKEGYERVDLCKIYLKAINSFFPDL